MPEEPVRDEADAAEDAGAAERRREAQPSSNGNRPEDAPDADSGDDVSGINSHHPFFRQIVEVYLLLDNVSTTKDKKLPVTIDASVFNSPEGQPEKDWIQQIAEIHIPPDDADEKALQVAKLYRARDALNAAAAPATSATIGFTLLAGGDQGADGGGSSFNRILPKSWRSKPQPGSRRLRLGNMEFSRSDLAAIAFPNFRRPAKRYRVGTALILFALVGWLVFTSVVSWHVATGNALVHRVETLNTEIQAIYTTLGKPAGVGTGSGSESSPPDAAASSATSPAPEPSNSASPAPVGASAPSAAASTNDLQDKLRQRVKALSDLDGWLQSTIWFGTKTCALFRDGCPANEGKAGDDPFGDWQWATILVAILANNVLPVFYGVLGAGAAIGRSLSAKTREYLLTPRDLRLSLIQLSLGAVIGATVGLFVSPTQGNAESARGLLEDIHLSTSALCFVAGFGVEAVFQALEALIARLFNLAPPPLQREP